MHTKYTVALARIIKEFSLEILSLEGSADDILISSTEINRPGLQMAGYYEFFDERRIQIIGKAEESFIGHFTS
ncbi:MAG: HPr kinase/phosphorylase, partial [Clostridia bacterium]|nr:HPr kinase/phosphorylase [Clostridia bacterium]